MALSLLLNGRLVQARKLQNGRVPKYAIPDSPLPPGAGGAARMLGINHVRMVILRSLQDYPEGATTGMLAQDLDLPYQTVVRHVRALEDDGLVSSDTEDRAGRRVNYTVDRTKVASLLGDLWQYLLPAKPQDD